MTYIYNQPINIKKSAFFIAAVLIFTTVFSNLLIPGGIPLAHADDITILEVSAVPNTGTVGVGQNLEVRMHHPDHMDDVVLNGECMINNKPVSTLENLGEGDYKLTYTVAEGDADVTSGQVPFNCSFTNAAGQTDTLTAFTDNNTVQISGHTAAAATTTDSTSTATSTTATSTDTTTTSTTSTATSTDTTGTGGTTGTTTNSTATSTSSTTDGNVNGNVQGGQPETVDNGTLALTSIEQVDTTATADGTFESGWKWVFHITVPTNETHLQLKFGNWLHTNMVNTISSANNMRISSAQAQSTSTTMIEDVDTYSAPMNITGDLNPAMPGRQVDVVVETAVPVGSLNGAYSAMYHIKSTQ